jgi:ammonia channel protein AmtB
VNKTINDTNPKKSIFKNIFRNFNLFSLAITIFLLFYGWFFFNLKLQDSDTNNAI